MTAQERFTVIYRTHYDSLLRYATRRTDPEMARDVTAETFLIAWRRLDRVPPEDGEVLPWLYGVARRVLANAERSQSRAERLRVRLQREPPSPSDDPSAEVTTQMLLDDALGRLSTQDREVLRLAGWEELDLGGIALAMACSRATMAVCLHRARRRLARELNRSAWGKDASYNSADATLKQETR